MISIFAPLAGRTGVFRSNVVNDLELRRYDVEFPAFFLSDTLQFRTAGAPFLFLGNIVAHVDCRKVLRELGAFGLLSGVSRYLDVRRDAHTPIVLRITFSWIEEPALLQLIGAKLFTLPPEELLLPKRYLVGENFNSLGKLIVLLI